MVEMKILGISGSLRAGSSNTAILDAIARFASKDIEIMVTNYIDQLPHFNPDLDKEDVISSVKEWRRQLALADGFLISCPEYAHGVPGVFKNALDWVVSSGEFVGKPVAFLNASPIVKASLVETLTVMSARIIEEASVQIQFLRNKIDKEGNLILDDEISYALEKSLRILMEEMRKKEDR